MNNDMFCSIFSDATVIDVDFSEWDKAIRLCVVGSDVEYPTPARLPLYVAEFTQVAEFNCRFRHMEVEAAGPADHFKWNIEDFRVTEDKAGRGLQVLLIGAGSSPNLEIQCHDVEIRQLDRSTVDHLFPNWNRPYAPLARPGIEFLATRHRN